MAVVEASLAMMLIVDITVNLGSSSTGINVLPYREYGV
jgi:hypothetical protein